MIRTKRVPPGQPQGAKEKQTEKKIRNGEHGKPGGGEQGDKGSVEGGAGWRRK